jgi:hypothetical protein
MNACVFVVDLVSGRREHAPGEPLQGPSVVSPVILSGLLCLNRSAGGASRAQVVTASARVTRARVCRGPMGEV